uniref:AAA-ATPase At3g28580-like n=1 Tax=Erigeron canadensis TaxID=72917 RepID=UPI001CB933AE|nr:AAA-ATPase At3g28580-like [Erigeron canadensis]
MVGSKLLEIEVMGSILITFLFNLTMVDMTHLGSILASTMFILACFRQWFPQELGHRIENYLEKLISRVYPYISIVFPEYQVEDYFSPSEAYNAIEKYLGTHSSKGAKRLNANVIKSEKSVFLSMDDYEEVTDEFKGIKIWWSSNKKVRQQQILLSSDDDEKRYFKLTCHRRHRDFITQHYLPHVIDEGKCIADKTRQRKLYTNNKKCYWTYILFEHPSTFDTLAMDPKKKKDILDDLIKFSKSKDYYKKVGKSWKRGYLLYGPPGTGKSSMIAAMANFLEYDIYDLELTSVQDNNDLRRLLIHTLSKSIIVIEDIDCSLDLTGQRKEKKDVDNGEAKNPIGENEKDKKKKGSEVTLSGLLNFIDGLWSACGSERLIIFTTNHIDKLDPALIRRGRMDKHIELSYCCFETFKVLAKNYLDLDSHDLFPTISRLLGTINMTPADVAESLIPISLFDQENVETCLNKLIKSLENARIKVEDEKVASEEISDENREELHVGDEEGKKVDQDTKSLKTKSLKGNEKKDASLTRDDLSSWVITEEEQRGC